jgi:hypothetical protein
MVGCALVIMVERSWCRRMRKRTGFHNAIDGRQSPDPGGAIGDESALIDPDLVVVIGAWLRLPEKVKAGIVAMVKATGRE